MTVYIIVAAISLIPAMIVARILGGGFRDHHVRYVLVFIPVFAALNYAGHNVILPQLKLMNARAEAKSLLLSDPLFSALVSAHPASRPGLESALLQAVREGAGGDRARAVAFRRAQGTIQDYFQDDVVVAGDGPVERYLGAMVQVLNELARHEGDPCYWLLTGSASDASQSLGQVPDERILALSEAMGKVVASAAESPRAIPLPSEGDALMEQLLLRLQARHGPGFMDALDAVSNANSPDVDRAMVCGVTTEMYREILRMPEDYRGPLIRYLLSGAGG